MTHAFLQRLETDSVYVDCHCAREGRYLSEVCAVVEIEGQQGLGLDEHI